MEVHVLDVGRIRAGPHESNGPLSIYAGRGLADAIASGFFPAET